MVRGEILGQRRLEGSDQPDFRHELDTAHRQHRPPGEGDEIDDVRCARVAKVDDEVRVLLADLRAAAARSLEPGLLDEPSREIALGIDEDGSGVGQAERLRGAAAIDVALGSAHVLELLVVVAAAHPAAGAGQNSAAQPPTTANAEPVAADATAADSKPPTADQVKLALRKVKDPELNLNIVAPEDAAAALREA